MPKSCRSAEGFDEQRGDLEGGQLWTAPSQRSKGDGIVISTTSRIDVEEGKGLDALGNSNDADDRIGSFVVRPSSLISFLPRRVSRLELTTLFFSCS